MTNELKTRLIAACKQVIATDAKPESISNLWSVMMEMPVADFTVGTLAAVDMTSPLTIGVSL